MPAPRWILLGLALLLAGGAVSAQQGRRDQAATAQAQRLPAPGTSFGDWRFADYDDDADGFVSPRELRTTQIFEYWDWDDDLLLEPDNLGPGAPFDRLDRDGDGRLTQAEFYGGLIRLYDDDGNQLLDPFEWREVFLFN